MKIYLFNPESGVYLGEDYADEEPMKRGSYRIPADATAIAPPGVGPGEAPVFNVAEQRWEIRPIKDLHDKINGTLVIKTQAEVTL